MNPAEACGDLHSERTRKFRAVPIAIGYKWPSQEFHRIEVQVKDEASAVLAAMGLTVSDAVRLLLTRVAHESALPFEPRSPNEPAIAAMRKARSGNLDSVSLGDLQAVLDVEN